MAEWITENWKLQKKQKTDETHSTWQKTFFEL